MKIVGCVARLGANVRDRSTGSASAWILIVRRAASAQPEPASAQPEPAMAAAPVPDEAAEADPEPAPAPADGAASATAAPEGVRLIALNMALSGKPREETARYLRENFQFDESAALLDEVYAKVGS